MNYDLKYCLGRETETEEKLRGNSMGEQLHVPAAGNTFERIKRTNSSGAEFWFARTRAKENRRRTRLDAT